MAKMTRAKALEYINAHPEYCLAPDKSGKGYVCPICGNGSGKDGDGLRRNPKAKSPHFKCFRCGFYGDMIDLIAKANQLQSGSAEAFEFARDLYDIELSKTGGYKMKEHTETGKRAPQAAQGGAQREAGANPQAEAQAAQRASQGAQKAYVRECGEAIEKAAEYLESRGISSHTATRARIGYDQERRAVVFPTIYLNGNGESGLSFVRRFTGSEKMRYQNAEGLPAGIFNFSAIKKEGPVFIVEGGFDALSIMELGYEAIALCSADNVDRFVQWVTQVGIDTKTLNFIIAMDNDKAGAEAAERLAEGLQALDIEFLTANIAEGYKDANEALTGNREALSGALRRARLRALNPSAAEGVERHKVGALLPDFKEYIREGASQHSIATGFKRFDKAIGGGLFPKLYVIGAISSLGKTTFALNIADNVAQSGKDVLIFSLEMPQEDIIGRSISRQTYFIAQEKHDMSLAKTELGITSYERYEHYRQAELNVISEAHKRYKEFAAERVSIYTGKHTAAQIKTEVEYFIEYTGRKPLVIVDYLQFVQPSEDMRRATIREQVNEALEVFLSIRRDLKTPIIVISSFNRGSYNTVADNSSFKESGEIEYSADAAITLELDIDRPGNSTKTTNKAKLDQMDGMRGNDKGEREIKLTFQKNRGNKVGSVVYLRYDPRFNYFTEDEGKEHIL